MPVVRVSNETYQKILELQAKDGNSMSVFMDRLIARYKELEDAQQQSEDRKSTKSGDKSGSPKRARASKKGDTKAEQSGRRLIEGLADVYED